MLELRKRSKAARDFRQARRLEPDNETYRSLAREHGVPDVKLLGGVLAGFVICAAPIVLLVLGMRWLNKRNEAARIRSTRRPPRKPVEPAEDADGLVDLSGFGCD